METDTPKGEWVHPGQRQWSEGRARPGFSYWFLPLEILGLMGPLIGAAISLFTTILALWAVKFANAALQSEFLSLMIGAVDRNIAWFFIAPLTIGYCQHLAKRFYAGYLVCMPIGNAAAFTFSAWVIAWVLRTIGALADVAFLFRIGSGVRENLALVFALVLLLGYVSVARAHLARSR
ncbi:MAG: hypothetical protein WC263_04740 [Candidatus Micrarchaeia archaeon]|jgi:hypothetical protein